MKHDPAQAAQATQLADATGEDTWFAKTGSGVQTWTLDELDLAFQRGDIDASTPVFTFGMSAWQTLGVIAGLDAPAANDTASDTAASSHIPGSHSAGNFSPNHGLPGAANGSPSGPREPRNPRAVPPPRSLPLPPPRTSQPPPLAHRSSLPPTSSPAFESGASLWASIATGPDLQTGVRRNAAVVPFAVRRSFGSILDIASHLASNMRASHPRWAALGPWLFGAAASGVLVFTLYRVANAPPRPGAHTRSGPTLVSAMPNEPVPAARVPAPSPGAPPEPATTRSATAFSDEGLAGDDAADGSSSAVPRTRDLQLSPQRAERHAAPSDRAKVKSKAWSKRSAKARAARKARRQRAQASIE